MIVGRGPPGRILILSGEERRVMEEWVVDYAIGKKDSEEKRGEGGKKRRG
jgi:hypothetical protein